MFKVGDKVVMLDTCNSGAAGTSEGSKLRRVQQAAENGIYMLTASKSGESHGTTIKCWRTPQIVLNDVHVGAGVGEKDG